MDLAQLRRIGLTSGEIALYQALLESGESTRTSLAKRSGISPSKIYDVANRLLEKGIISSVKKNGVIHFQAADPTRLSDFLDAKEAEIAAERALVEQVMPTLLSQYREHKEATDVEVFTGWHGMRTVFDDLASALGPGEDNVIYGASAGQSSAQADLFFSRYYEKKRKKGFGTKIIFNEDVRGNTERTAIFTEKPNEMRFLHQQTFTEVNTYHDVVLFIMLLAKPMVVRITSAEAADSCRKVFATLWAQAAP